MPKGKPSVRLLKSRIIAPKIASRLGRPQRVVEYIREIKRKIRLPRAISRRETVAYRKLLKKATFAMHKEFLRQYRASVVMLNKRKAWDRLHRYAQREHPEAFEKSERDDVREINKYFSGWDKNVHPEKMADVIKYYSMKAADMGGQQALNDLGISVAFHLKNPEVIDALDVRGDKISGKISKTTLDTFRETMKDLYMSEGLDPREAKKSIKELFEETYFGRAWAIARTEIGIAQSTVQFETYSRNGVTKKRWMAVMDDRTRESHADANEEIVGIDEEFSNGLMFPLDPNGPPEEVINCRCDWAAAEFDTDSKPDVPWTGQEEGGDVPAGDIEEPS